jgi:hypothetical protein
MLWRGRPLTSREVFFASIAVSTTRTGLRVKVHPDYNPCHRH